MTLDLIVLLLSTITSSILGLMVFLRNVHSRVGRTFLLITLALVAWAVSNYVADHAADIAINELFTRLTFVAGIWIVLALLTFSFIFPKDRLGRTQGYGLLALLVVLTVFSVSSFVTKSVSKSSQSVGIELETGDLYIFYLLAILGMMLFTLFNLYRNYKASNLLRRNQIRFIAFGIGISTLLGVLLNLVLPIVLNDWTSSRFGPLATVTFVGALAYAIVRYRFLNIRLIITRSIAYVLLLATLTIAYSLAIFAASRLFFTGEALPISQQLVYLAMAIIIAFTFQPLRRFFNRLTRAIFYRDAYDTQTILDTVSATLVSASSVSKLINGVMGSVNRAVKARFAHASIVSRKKARSIVVGKKTDIPDDLLFAVTSRNKPILVIDEMDDASLHQGLYQTFRKSEVALVVRLQTSKEFIGLVYFGPKESGTIYTAQDINLIRIVADELAIAIQNALRFEEIERFNQSLQFKIEEATAELRQSNKKLKALDEAKDEFISMASHQLRTPLTSVKGYVSMALDGDAGELNKNQRRLLQEAYASSQRMVYMIADFLNVSRLKTGKFLLEPSTISLPQMIKEEVAQLAPSAEARGLTVETTIPDKFPALQLDETKIRQVIMNFIDNAIFYSNSGGDIVITLGTTDKEVTFTFKDNGIGVPAAERANIFTQFFRATNARHVRPDGTGIGLFMAKKVINAHGGEMIFESHENKGSTFGFRLPMHGKTRSDAKIS